MKEVRTVMSEKYINIITSTVRSLFGGRTKSLLKRARIFVNAGLKVHIVTTNFNQDYTAVLSSLKSRGYIDDHIEFINIFSFFMKNPQQNSNVQEFIKQKYGDLSQYKTRQRDENLDYYSLPDDKRIFAIRKSENKITLIDDFKGGKRPMYRHYVNQNGKVSRTRTYVHGTWEPIQDDILDGDLTPIVTFHLMNKKKTDIILHLDTEYYFNSETDFFTFFYDQLFHKQDVVINDARLLDRALLNTHQPVQKIFQLHNTQLVDPRDLHSAIKKSYQSVLTSKENIHIVTLTKKQRDVIVSEVPTQKTKIVTIPHSISVRKISVKRRTNHAVIVARLEQQKNIEDGIIAFSIFLNTYPEFILDIYGTGDNLDNLKALVNRLGIDTNVIFHGYTDQTDEVYQSADFSIMTSQYEAFALTVLESIANGTQVVSYDVNFGPAEILGDSAGYIPNENTPESLSICMVQAVEKPRKLTEILSRAGQFSNDIFFKRWKELMDLS